jgi:dTDP-4-dehydrorhamnose 3,5-epimerase
MKLSVSQTPLSGVVVIDTDCFADERGHFYESWNLRDFRAAGLDLVFVQESHSRSRARVIRGLHYQDMTAPVGKLVRCTMGEVFDVAVDLRAGSETFGRWFGVQLTGENRRQIFIPAGFAHGFQALTQTVEVQYKQTAFYAPSAEGTIAWNDADIGVAWPLADPIVSPRDGRGMLLSEYVRAPAFRIDDPRL